MADEFDQAEAAADAEYAALAAAREADYRTAREAITANVQRGADLLDRAAPGWHEKIDLDDLDMRSPRWCILGQAFHDEATAALGELFLGAYSYALLRLHVHDSGGPRVFGFFWSAYPYTISDDQVLELDHQLGAEWKTLVLARRASPPCAVTGGAS